MAIYPIPFPTRAPTQEILRVAFQQAAMESPHTFAQQTVSKADHWLLEFQWPRMSHSEAERIAAWIDSLRGQLGTFTYTPRSSAKSSLQGITVAQIAYSYSSTVSLTGWAAQGVSGLSLGQYCQIGERLHRIVSAPANADANGRCLVEVVPQIRKTKAVGTTVEFQNPKGMFRFTSADSYAFTLDPDRQPSFPTIQAKEAF
ncbi:hypothetical protein [Sphingomonas sp. Leaf257]|jgi:hypothetical protein|uniref:hypothetical protein n=1 Tax=Sphingomonas sp. Leaf257 TaxID=1736309 RepID=UPI0006F8B333|nr:hypothetical protein [Sphingomonas sp. Leaf257]KQO58394.1 hypothetical protein ASF14_00030 [Sphingomonas sp. Leaf257]